MDKTAFNRKRRQFKELNLVGVSDMAKRLGWDNAKVTTYTKRGHFPDPIGLIGGRPVWLFDQVEPYLEQWAGR